MFKKLLDKFTNLPYTKISIVIFILFFCILCVIETYDGGFIYPESTYQSLEKEADSITQEKSFVSDYHLTINSYDNATKELTMGLSHNRASLDIVINNYNEINEEIVIERVTKNTCAHILWLIFALLIMALCYTIFTALALFAVGCLLLVILFFIEFIISVLKKFKS